jgi:hypothetical protein
METVTLKLTIGEDRHLTIDVPEAIPSGPIEVTIRSLPAPADEGSAPPLTRERARELLAAGGMLSTAFAPPPGTAELTPEQRRELGQYFAGDKDMAALIDEDRGPY